MEIFYIPFNPDQSHGWVVPIPRDGEKQFASRPDALAFARKLALTEAAEQGERSYLCVEGGDNQWRLFTPDLKPVN
ncbi:hypothetical protein HDE78_003032 [Rhodanobacter sp. K2T2]|uniref:hypothetical protein n=1 Tax=Rhodanobacter sp. K2T2 TaxID=2723085 RepID=UPI0015CCC439|nr:hypothetical protein [Rhodanobacter sp. K2T2]NYE30064.1 hypothetical protein [Rhodanobacter sp. K2T2]